MLEDYLGIDFKRVAWFSSLVVVVAILTTFLYWFIFGFESWNKNVQIASDLMLAAVG
ncbi:MAG: hypothetical protein HQK64_04435 [Desulfamplus sp.]|nr:hypothetical protein [Desulfamplus sp.]MBF0209263.1 hypothetical protein [Desulfamplus sp.]MBF0241709.1 hypothetical protein [Desulfamplus sp.]MBF0388584.1 hypothetical protein [Desulfamplus sp.]